MNSRMLHEWALRKKNLQFVLYLICSVPITMKIGSKEKIYTKYCTKNILEIPLMQFDILN